MKTLRVSDEVHAKLTRLLGTLMAQTGKMQTYEEVLAALIGKSVKLPPDLLAQVETFIEENKHVRYSAISSPFSLISIVIRSTNSL